MSRNRNGTVDVGEKKDVVHTAMEISPSEIQAVVQSDQTTLVKLETLSAMKKEVEQRMKASAEGAELEPLLTDLQHAIDAILAD